MPRPATATLGSTVGVGHSDADVLVSLFEEVAGAKVEMEIRRLQQELVAAKFEAQRYKSQAEGGGSGYEGVELRQVAVDALAAAKAELSESHAHIQQLRSELQNAKATADELKRRVEAGEGENTVLEESLAASKGLVQKVMMLERLLQESEARSQTGKETAVLGNSADSGIVGEKRTGLAAVLADLGFKNPEQTVSAEWQKHPTELQIRCQEAEGVANMLMRELQEARAQTAAMGERLDSVMQQRMGPRGHHPNMLQGPSHFRPDARWDSPRGPPMGGPMYRGQPPPNHTWGAPPPGPSHVSPFRDDPHDRPTAPPLYVHFGGPSGMPAPPHERHEMRVDQAGMNRQYEAEYDPASGPPLAPPHRSPMPPSMDVNMHHDGGMGGGPQRFARPMGGPEFGGVNRMSPQAIEGGGQGQKAVSGEQDLGSLIRDLQQQYGSEDNNTRPTSRHNSTLIPSSVIMSAQGNNQIIRPTAAPTPPLKPIGLSEGAGGVKGGDEWVDEVIMYRGSS